MNIYSIVAPVEWGDSRAVIDDNKGRIADFFRRGVGDGKFLKFVKPSAIVKGLDSKKLLKTDFLPSTIGMLLISEKAKKLLENHLENEVEFFECDIKVGDEVIPFYIGKILKENNLVDKENSVFHKLSDGREILSQPKFLTEFEEPFLLAKDKEFKNVFAASESFKNLVVELNLQMAFL